MPLLATSLVWYKSKESSNQATNGGALSALAVTDAAKNNLFPDVSQAERSAGATHYRKLFMKVDDPIIGLQNSALFVETASVGDDIVTLFPATKTDTEAGITGAEQQYGMGTVQAGVLAGVSAIVITVEDWATAPIFVDGMSVRLTDAASVDVSGTIETVIIAVGGVSATGNDITLTFTTPLANPWGVGDKCSSVVAGGTLAATANATIVTSVGGAYNDGGNPIGLNNQSVVDDTWTLTFTSSTAFDIVGSASGAVGSGSTSSDALPNNPDYGLPYFTFLSAGFSGSFLSGDTIVFATASASAPIWAKRVVPAGAASLSANSVIMAVEGESV